MRVEDVKKFAMQLRSEGIDAFEYGESNPNGDGIRVGIQVAELGFFFIDELNDPSNEQLVAAREFVDDVHLSTVARALNNVEILSLRDRTTSGPVGKRSTKPVSAAYQAYEPKHAPGYKFRWLDVELLYKGNKGADVSADFLVEQLLAHPTIVEFGPDAILEGLHVSGAIRAAEHSAAHVIGEASAALFAVGVPFLLLHGVIAVAVAGGSLVATHQIRKLLERNRRKRLRRELRGYLQDLRAQ